MKYDFTMQKNMMNVALTLLEEKNLLDVSALGGGTALAAHYWQHRYSTDIDIFIHSKDDISLILRQSQWSKKFLNQVKELGFTGDVKIHPIYTEITIQDEFKIQFLSVEDRTKEPYSIKQLWGKQIQLESIEEIIAKKIYYRAHKANARDLFDIAVSIHKNPDMFDKMNLSIDKIKELQKNIQKIKINNSLKDKYFNDISKVSPSQNYTFLAQGALDYLSEYLEDYCNFHERKVELGKEDYKEIEKQIYIKTIKSIEDQTYSKLVKESKDLKPKPLIPT